MKINIKNADKLPQFTEEIGHDSSLDIIEEHSDLEGFSKKLGVKFTDDKDLRLQMKLLNLVKLFVEPHLLLALSYSMTLWSFVTIV